MAGAQHLPPVTLLAAAHAAGATDATVADGSSGEWCVWYVDLPIGRRWHANGCTFVKAEWQRSDAAWRRTALAAALEDIKAGAYDADADEIAEDRHNQGES